MSNERHILDSLECSTMVSNWTQYLCVRHIKPGAAIAEICQYEMLCEFELYDEDGNEIEIPNEIDGQEVIKFEDGYLVGGELCVVNDGCYEYTSKDLDGLTEWIKENDFELNDTTLTTLKRALREPV